jgi:hypothetical protein
MELQIIANHPLSITDLYFPLLTRYDENEDDSAPVSSSSSTAPLSIQASSALNVKPKWRPRSATIIDMAQSPSTSSSTASQPPSPKPGWMGRIRAHRPLLLSCLKALVLFLVCLGVLVVLLRTLLPPIDPEDAPSLKVPKSFEDLKQLNRVLQVPSLCLGHYLPLNYMLTCVCSTQVYKERNFYRVLGCFVVVYLFLQAFSLPGSMYLSILAGALWGVFGALTLVCFVRVYSLNEPWLH